MFLYTIYSWSLYWSFSMELILEVLYFLPVIADHSYDLATGNLKIDIVGVG